MISKALVGYTGFVGSNLNAYGDFQNVYNTKNINEAFGLKPDILIYAGLRAEKYIANKFPERDFDNIQGAIQNIKKIKPKQLVLISTIDVYDKPNNVDENTEIKEENLAAYGKNRLYLEKWVQENINKYLILRLPGLYGINIKKNFIYDYIYKIPKLLNEKKYFELCEKNHDLKQYYLLNDDGFYQVKMLNSEQKVALLHILDNLNFSALNFTDSRGIFQYYNLRYLAKDINIALNNKISKLNLSTEPISISELYFSLTGNEFKNEIAANPPFYNFKTIHDGFFGGENGYITNKRVVLSEIREFISAYSENIGR